MIFEPRIAKMLHLAYHSDGRVGFHRIQKGLTRSLKGDVTRRKVKYAIAGLISDLSIKLKRPVEMPELRSLFDAFAKAKGEASRRRHTVFGLGLREGDSTGSPEVEPGNKGHRSGRTKIVLVLSGG